VPTLVWGEERAVPEGLCNCSASSDERVPEVSFLHGSMVVFCVDTSRQPALAGDAPGPARGWRRGFSFPGPHRVKQTIYLAERPRSKESRKQ